MFLLLCGGGPNGYPSYLLQYTKIFVYVLYHLVKEIALSICQIKIACA